jgi:AraC-like DNA-binding protein/quercetin dioxygenase-like cupin family protein
MATTRNKSPDSSQTANGFNATVGQIVMVMRRSPRPDWAIHDVANARYHTLVLAIAGRAVYECAGQKFEVKKGQMLFFPKGVVHSGRSDPKDPWSYFFVTFDLHCHDRRAKEMLLRLPCRSTPANAQESQSLFSEMDRLWVRHETGFWLRCRSITLQLLYTHLRCCVGAAPEVLHSDKLATVVALLHSNPARNYTVQELAERMELSPSRFRKLFKAYTGQTAILYQNWLRVNKAKDLLLSGECSVHEAAEEVGIHDPYYFSRLFRQLLGRSPSSYRNQ